MANGNLDMNNMFDTNSSTGSDNTTATNQGNLMQIYNPSQASSTDSMDPQASRGLQAAAWANLMGMYAPRPEDKEFYANAAKQSFTNALANNQASNDPLHKVGSFLTGVGGLVAGALGNSNVAQSTAQLQKMADDRQEAGEMQTANNLKLFEQAAKMASGGEFLKQALGGYKANLQGIHQGVQESQNQQKMDDLSDYRGQSLDLKQYMADNTKAYEDGMVKNGADRNGIMSAHNHATEAIAQQNSAIQGRLASNAELRTQLMGQNQGFQQQAALARLNMEDTKLKQAYTVNTARFQKESALAHTGMSMISDSVKDSPDGNGKIYHVIKDTSGKPLAMPFDQYMPVFKTNQQPQSADDFLKAAQQGAATPSGLQQMITGAQQQQAAQVQAQRPILVQQPMQQQGAQKPSTKRSTPQGGGNSFVPPPPPMQPMANYYPPGPGANGMQVAPNPVPMQQQPQQQAGGSPHVSPQAQTIYANWRKQNPKATVQQKQQMMNQILAGG